MSAAMNEHNIHEFLSAFADGELDPAQNLAVLDYLESHPAAFAYLRDRQRLRQSAQRVVLADQSANAMPTTLKERLNRLAADGPPPPPDPSHRPHNARRWWTRGLGQIAAGVLVGSAAALIARPTSPKVADASVSIPPRPRTAQQIDLADSAIPVAFVNAATRVHVDCSRLADRLHAAAYPRELGPLSASVRRDLSSASDAPDLSSIGYRFVGAGPCARPLEGTVHLLYRAVGIDAPGAISVFAQPYRGQFDLRPGRLYRVASDEAAFPMSAWRTETVVYFLIADDAAAEVAARRALDADWVPRMSTLIRANDRSERSSTR